MGAMTSDDVERKRHSLLFKVASRLQVLKSGNFAELERLTIEQLAFINHRLGIQCYLSACPGSGKTEVVGVKAAFEFAAWTSNFNGLAILTFTNNAAAQIRERVLKHGGMNAAAHPHFIGTFDSWMHNYIFQPFGPRYVGYNGRSGDKKISIIESDSKAGFLNAYTTPMLSDIMPVKANEFSFNADGIPETFDNKLAAIILENQNRAALEHCKKKFWRSGFATYQDAEFISYKVLLENRRVAALVSKRFPVAMVDECQDLSPAQLRLLELLQGEGTAVHLVGDLEQAIYEFRNVDPVKIREFIGRHKFAKRQLTHNFRSNQHIVDVCQRIANKAEAVKGMRDATVSPSCALFEYTNENLAELPDKFVDLLTNLGIAPARCAIVARGRTTLSKVAPQKEGRRAPVELFAAALNSYYGTPHKTDDLSNALEQIGKSISYLAFDGDGNYQRQYCPEDMNAVRWRTYLFNVIERAAGLFPFKEKGAKLTWSKWVAKLKKFLNEEWARLPGSPAAWGDVESKLKARSGQATTNVADALVAAKKIARIRTTTIHDVKGESLDAILLVSAPDKHSKGGHFEHWLTAGAGNEEHRRFAYVACSRPKHLLIIAACKLNDKNTKRLTALGLTPIADLVGSVKKRGSSQNR